ncbi:COG4223 family protein [Roseicyclus mahoneyensis]|uniref:Inner membrane protein n=1 Tax=Roseicyclus mahoneyensis TaxID=164332 RepID=A0A316GL68_9RHOB|nr:hypothetical protein [Roseicyclus mahoneyensis]PWK61417.1 hypothetical protein C7455_102103 [Roseicyclus mahoneyensis]
MARGSSKSSGGTRKSGSAAENDTLEAQSPETVEAATDSLTMTPETDTIRPDDSVEESAEARAPSDTDPTTAAEQTTTDADAAKDSVTGGAGDDSIVTQDTSIEDAEIISEPAETNETLVQAEPERPAPPPPPSAPAPAPLPERRSGVVPLVLGGIIAAGIGYGAAYMGWLPTAQGDSDQSAAFTAALEGPNETLAALQARVAELESATPDTPVMPEVDLTPVLDQIGALGTRIDDAAATLEALTARVTTLEDRPVFSGDVDADSAAAVEAAARLEAELEAERTAAAEQAATLQAAAEAAQAAAAEAEAAAAAAIAETEAQAQAAVARAAADAAVGQVQAALETGAPFAEPLAALSQVVEVPEGLAAVADTGVPTLDALQTAFPPLARAALPAALQETAGEAMTDRLGAFVMGQIGGRSVEPREGDDPDAVLSRVEAGVRSGDLRAALAELAALPESARSELAAWAVDVEARADAVEGLATLGAALARDGN